MGTFPATRTAISLLILTIIATAAGSMAGCARSEPGVQTGEDGASPQESVRLPEFILIDHHGNPFTRGRLEGRWSFLFFGYTNCPDICPMTLSLLAAVKEQVVERGGEEKAPQVVFVTVDPERDTILQMERYATWFDPDFFGLTGSSEETGKLAAALGVAISRVDNPQRADEYTIDHGTALYLIDPDGRLAAIIEPPHGAAAIADGYLQLLSESTTR